MTNFKRFFCYVAVSSMIGFSAIAGQSTVQPTDSDFTPKYFNTLRLPSVPLLVNDPYFSFWSNYDQLNAGPTRHWCEHEKAIDGFIRVDGTVYRFMGKERECILKPLTGAGMTIDGENWSGRVSHTKQNNEAWAEANFDDSSWAQEQAAWGTAGEYPNVKNVWKDENSDIYVRREVTLTADDLAQDLWVQYSHDDIFELYINGINVVRTGETWRQGEMARLNDLAKSSLKVGKNIIAAHCHNTRGGAYIDFGLYANVKEETVNIVQAQQTSVNVQACSSYYKFTCGPVNLDVVFTAPMLIDDFDLISTPINFISYRVTPNDGNAHDVQFYISTSAQLTVNEMAQPTLSCIETNRGNRYLKAGSEAQRILGRSGDMISIDWGYLYIPEMHGQVSMGAQGEVFNYFATTGELPASDGSTMRSTGISSMPTLAFINDLGSVSGSAADFMMIGYDEIYDMQYMRQNYKAYYARNGKTIFEAFEEFERDYASLMQRCRDLDNRIWEDGVAAGNVKYAEQLAATYRHCMAAHKLFQDNTGKALYFSKENKSNGCVNTVDLTYPESPLFLTYNPELQKGMILSILDYALTDERKDKNCAAHDLGQYPLANGQVYGDSMPLEESANILILANAIVRVTGDASWLRPYSAVLKTWADYCRAEGQNPRNQLCTDDFKGPSEQNTNLSVKAIMGVLAYSELYTKLGGTPRGALIYENAAKDMALIWESDARDGDHYRMEFHRSGTWSQKYNLVWDKLWGRHIFPSQVLEREINWYLRHQERYGLPLDSRDKQTKSDWIHWTAAMSPDTETFLKFSDLHWKYINETSTRIPLSDYYWADGGASCNFSARSVIGGLWMKVMMDKYMPEAPEWSWAPKGNHIKTRWAEDVDPACPLPEYPRPQLVRKDWMNLNGIWEYAIESPNTSSPEFDGKILVPYAIESSLSGVMRPLEPGNVLWYKREVTIPEEWKGRQIVLNFGAVDYKAEVFVNGTNSRSKVKTHEGGHCAFSVDITSKFNSSNTATIYVKVTDATNENEQPVGKQRRYPNGRGDIFYTSTSGIWQTVWLEPVDKMGVETIRSTSDIDNNKLNFDIALRNPAGTLTVDLYDGETLVESKEVAANAESVSVEFTISNPKLWSTTDPNLYNATVSVKNADGEVVDAVDTYAGMRKISYRQDENGYWRLQLNNRDFFHFGPLDQGYWPDGLLTAPTDEALLYDIELTKELGFNMIRKHMKVEPARWYYHCDRLGLLVWQDMPSASGSPEGGWVAEDFCTNIGSPNPTLESRYRSEWAEIINQLYSSPSIVVWTPFNEHWGQFKTPEIVEYTRSLDNTRLINPASGGNHYRLDNPEGTFIDMHNYDQPIRIYDRVIDESRPFVLGEYGGLGRNMPGNRWYERNSQTYNTFNSAKELTDAYIRLADQIISVAQGTEVNGTKVNWCAAVYTQTTDVETEVNGIVTYDREKMKFEQARMAEATERVSKVFGTDSGVESVVADFGERTYYNMQGYESSTPFKGINIVREADGTVRKRVFK